LNLPFLKKREPTNQPRTKRESRSSAVDYQRAIIAYKWALLNMTGEGSRLLESESTERVGREGKASRHRLSEWHQRPRARLCGPVQEEETLVVPGVTAALTSVEQGAPQRVQAGNGRPAAGRHHRRRTNYKVLLFSPYSLSLSLCFCFAEVPCPVSM
jgi:hypothetical protein